MKGQNGVENSSREFHLHRNGSNAVHFAGITKQTTIEHDFYLVLDELAGRYDMIIRIDVMSAIGVKIDFSTQEIEWVGATAPMKD